MLICLLIEKLNPVVTELFIRGKKLKIYFVFITQSYFAVLSKRKIQEIAFNHSSDIDFQDFMNFYKKCTAKPYSFLVIDTTLASDNRLRFGNNLLEKI